MLRLCGAVCLLLGAGAVLLLVMGATARPEEAPACPPGEIGRCFASLPATVVAQRVEPVRRLGAPDRHVLALRIGDAGVVRKTDLPPGPVFDAASVGSGVIAEVYSGLLIRVHVPSVGSVETLDHPREQVVFGFAAAIFLFTFGSAVVVPATGRAAAVLRVLMVAALIPGLAVMLRAVNSVPVYTLVWLSTAAAAIAVTVVIRRRRAMPVRT